LAKDQLDKHVLSGREIFGKGHIYMRVISLAGWQRDQAEK